MAAWMSVLVFLPGLLWAADFSKSPWVQLSRLGGGHMPISALAADGEIILAGNDSGLFRSKDLGRTWKRVLDDETRGFVVAKDRIYAGGLYHIHRSADHGETWTDVSKTLDISTSVRAMAVSGGWLIAGIEGIGISRSKDQGENWRQARKGPENGVVHALAADGKHAFAGTPWGVYVSADNGETWTLPEKPLNGLARSLVFHGGDLFAGTFGEGVFRTDDAGQTWREADAEMDQQNVNALCESGGSRESGSALYAGGTEGVYRYSDKGDVWIPHGTGLSDKNVLGLVASGPNLIAGSGEGKIYCLGPDCGK